MKKWLMKFDDAMEAAAYAEEGEFQAARDILQKQRTIMLALTGNRDDANAFKYAVSVCNRIGATLEILHSINHDNNSLKQFRKELTLKKIECRLIKVGGCVRESVLKYTSRRSDIVFVVVRSSDDLDLNCKKTKKIISKSWVDLKCPLVVVSDLVKA